MSLSIADQYYAKALDEYPFNLEEFVESLNYALSYDSEHVGANSLMARFYHEKMKDYDKSAYYYEAALASDPENSRIYLDYALLCITAQSLEKANKLLQFAHGLQGVEMAVWFRLKGLYFEAQKQYKPAKKNYRKAIFESMETDYIDFMKSEISRVETKLKLKKRKTKKPASK
jgi:tetratricopeptide (TPR) repeat protein